MEAQFKPTQDDIVAFRRLMAHRLESNMKPELLSKPLSLGNMSDSSRSPEGLTGPHREYFEALKSYQQARDAFAEEQNRHKQLLADLPARQASEHDPLEAHLRSTELKQRLERIEVLNKHLDLLDEQPAASSNFLNLDAMLKNSSAFPDAPKEMVAGFAVTDAAKQSDADELVRRLETAVLRNKLLARNKQERLASMRRKHNLDPGQLSASAKFSALSSVKNTLVEWIETQLSKAGDGESLLDGGGGSGSGGLSETTASAIDLDGQLAAIQSQYNRYVELRKGMIITLARIRQQMAETSEVKPEQQNTEDPAPSIPTAIGYLLVPSMEKLLSLAREQKAVIQEKSHIINIISNQKHVTSQAIDHLADESQLLPLHPLPTQEKAKSDFGEETRDPGRTNPTRRVQPWIHAADAAKIATLETVAERLDEGGLATEESMTFLREIHKLLNDKPESDVPTNDEGPTEEDLWLAEGEDGSGRAARRHIKKQNAKSGETIWSILDGKLGLINEAA